MDRKTAEKYREAGRIAKKALDKASSMIEGGVKLEKVAEKTETIIKDEGAQPAFPVNLSLNDEAAHYTPERGDKKVFSKRDLVKVDVGAHVDGYIGDTAATVDLGNNKKLVESAKMAGENCLKAAEPGISLGRLGEIAENTIKKKKFNPVQNLGGHSLDKYEQHAGTRIPCIKTDTMEELEVGRAYAIECFATDGSGKVIEGKSGNIYKYQGGNVRDRTSRKILKVVKNNYRTLPFTSRWLRVPKPRMRLAINQMVRKGIIKDYGILKEEEGGQVAQHEHTLIVTEEGIEITTK